MEGYIYISFRYPVKKLKIQLWQSWDSKPGNNENSNIVTQQDMW